MNIPKFRGSARFLVIWFNDHGLASLAAPAAPHICAARGQGPLSPPYATPLEMALYFVLSHWIGSHLSRIVLMSFKISRILSSWAFVWICHISINRHALTGVAVLSLIHDFIFIKPCSLIDTFLKTHKQGMFLMQN